MGKKVFIVLAALVLSLSACSSASDEAPGNAGMLSDAASGNAGMFPDVASGNPETFPDDVPGSSEAVLDTVDIETMQGWSFQYNEETDDYSLFFGLLDKRDGAVSADVDVDIRIVNDSGEEVYAATNTVTDSDFGYYESAIAGERYLANVRIPASEIEPGMSSSGTVYFTVYKGDSVRFDEVDCKAFYCLPVRGVDLTVEELPVELKVKKYDGSTESIIEITEVSYTFENEYTPRLNIILKGQKTYGSSSSYDIISYKLYDSEGYMVEAGSVYLSSLDNGDKFKDDSITIYDVVPGESYSLRLTEYSW